ncbi:hypothetical protein [Micromonospora tulbaghiae]|uniref:hypothetical protein n=1 Tax=Micromonospora tulbaghiae TaxID=479978 RepID=UPI0033DE9218
MIGDLPGGVPTPLVGDNVLVRGVIKQYTPGVGALVEFFSKTDQYEVWIRPDLIADVLLPNPPAEPVDGTWLHGNTTPGHTAFVRDDSGSGSQHDEDRRFPRRWFDVAAQEYIDWPTAVRRGADPQRLIGVSQ